MASHRADARMQLRSNGSHIIFHVSSNVACAPHPLNLARPSLAGSPHPRLSIVTPAFNAGKFLPTLMASMTAVTERDDVEWILVDDGSTDNTAALFAELATTHPNCRLVQQSNGGVAAARNRGFDESRGEYVWFVDADDEVVANAFAALDVAAHDGSDLIAFQATRVVADEPDAKIFRCQKPINVVSGEVWVSLLIAQKEWRHFLWQYWYRRQFLIDRQIRFASGIVHEDIGVVTAAALHAANVRYVDQVAYRYRVNPESLSSSRDGKRLMTRIESYFAVIEQLRDINRQARVPPATRRQLRGEVVGQALQVFEVAKQLDDRIARHYVIDECRRRRFAQSLFADVTNFKRFRQALTMWLKQMGYLPMGRVKGAR